MAQNEINRMAHSTLLSPELWCGDHLRPRLGRREEEKADKTG